MTKMALVPGEATQAMSDALVGELLPVSEWSFQAGYAAMIGASPSSGRVSRADLERAALDPRARIMHIVRLSAALQSLGLPLESGIQDEGGVR
jgi:hypothetical protein